LGCFLLSSEPTVLVSNLDFFPDAVAVDPARGLVYVADAVGSLIQVYNTKGTLVTTIK
jgi:DNA-binding beta-propeller fold protein YncE